MTQTKTAEFLIVDQSEIYALKMAGKNKAMQKIMRKK